MIKTYKIIFKELGTKEPTLNSRLIEITGELNK